MKILIYLKFLQKYLNVDNLEMFIEVNIHFSAAVTPTVTITRDSGAGENYDTILLTQSLTGSEQDLVWRLTGKCVLFSDDILKIVISDVNANAYVTVIPKEL